MSYYSSYTEDYPQLLNKYEFTSNDETHKKNYIYQEPIQLLLRNYMSLPTPYENILLYAYLGTGKTCTSISIAEGFKEYVSNMGRKIVVLVKNQNIKKNFYNELLSSCTRSDYITDTERQIYFNTQKETSYTGVENKKELVNRLNRTINKYYNFITYGKFVNQVLGSKEITKDINGKKSKSNSRVNSKNPLNNFNNTVIIVDEAHNITNTDVYIALKKILTNSYNYRLILLTATPISDNSKEIFELSNLLNINNTDLQLPIRNELLKPNADNEILLQRLKSNNINNSLLKGGIINITKPGLEKLKSSLYGKVSHIQANVDTYPTTIEKGVVLTNKPGSIKAVLCQMSEYQYTMYVKGLKNDIKDTNDSSVDITTIQNSMGGIYKNSSDASTMSYPKNLIGKDGFTSVFVNGNNELKLDVKNNLKKYSNKIFTLLENVKKSPGNVFIFTNYVNNGGTRLLKEIFLLFGYTEYKNKREDYNSFIIFDESATVDTREKYRQIFNHPSNKDGKNIKIIIGSPIISEGITLKNVRQVHLLEPSWNMSRINQIIGRAVRNYSHHDLPEADRNVEIYKYASVYNTTGNSFFIDKEKYILSEEKDRSNKIIERLLKRVAFDCEFLKSRNTKDATHSNTSQCDYTKCNYSCIIHSPQNPLQIVDKSTYRLHLNYFDKFDIDYVKTILRELFSKYFIWSLTDITKYIQNKSKKISFDVIYHTLTNIIDNKLLFHDMYNRDGFIINKGEYYIFNAVGIDINTSLYTKMFDFSIDINKYNIDEFVKLKYNKDLFDNTTKKKKANVDTPIQELSQKQIDYNNNIIDNYELFGTFRGRGTVNNPFGPITDKFRIIDLRNSKGKRNENEEDKRKNITGMVITSFKKPVLLEIANYLKITLNNGMSLSDYGKADLGKIIENKLVKLKLVLR